MCHDSRMLDLVEKWYEVGRQHGDGGDVDVEYFIDSFGNTKDILF